MGAKKSRDKGKRGELEFSNLVRTEYGYKDARRGQQYCGLTGAADVVGLPGLHVEVKRVERLNIYNAIEQSQRDARDRELPVVAHRRNHSEWLITMTLSAFMEIYREYASRYEESSHQYVSYDQQKGVIEIE